MEQGVERKPIEPLDQAFDRAIGTIEKARELVALFMVDGRIRATKSTSENYQKTVDRLIGNLIGVYDIGVDARVLRGDLEEFYGSAK
jgi:hypothetical protein